MNFRDFEKNNLSSLLNDDPYPNYQEFNKNEIDAIENDVKYGQIEYIESSILYLPNRENCRTIILQRYLGKTTVLAVLKEITYAVRTPFKIYIDFWALSKKDELKVLFPSLGTVVNTKKYMKTDDDVEDLLKNFDAPVSDLQIKVTQAHGRSRLSFKASGVQVKKLLTMWVRIDKLKY